MTSAGFDATYAELLRHTRRAADLASAAAVLFWDQATYMPRQGAAARGRQMALLEKLAHEAVSDPRLGELLATLEAHPDLDAEDVPAAVVRVARRDHDRATRVPATFVEEAHAHFAASYDAWTKAREEGGFAVARPFLERTVELSQRYASYFPNATHPADPMIDASDPGMTARTVGSLFEALRRDLVPLARELCDAPPVPDTPLRGRFDGGAQLALALEVARRMGLDPERARQDVSPHPFMTRFSAGDVRITTRVREDHLEETIFSTIHETGHALYELGIDPAFDGTPLAAGASSGVHESQSRLYENLVARSRAFWEFWYPRFQERFPSLAAVPLGRFHRAIHRVKASPIRTDADEVTYNLHVMIRFDLELALLDGGLEVRDLAEAWRERYRQDLGVEIRNDAEGVLQDVHWFDGFVGGAFQGYTIGNLLAAQLFERAVAEEPEIEPGIARGDFEPLNTSLRERVHRHGRRFPPAELIARATGRALETGPLVAHLRSRFEEVHGK